mmetsp:Transcript_6718/g.11558  ORF Transcript_6718/g.11558 Transcript_6718/m.11558 type:complete len:144 (+) Transcript_6718:69-500(+)
MAQSPMLVTLMLCLMAVQGDAVCCKTCGPSSKPCGGTCISEAYECHVGDGCACACAKECPQSKACGMSCISVDYTCHKPTGAPCKAMMLEEFPEEPEASMQFDGHLVIAFFVGAIAASSTVVGLTLLFRRRDLSSSGSEPLLQ